MTYTEVVQMLEQMGLPVVYYSWPEEAAPALPYIVYYYPTGDGFEADNINYANYQALNIELYTENKDFDLEKQMEDILTQFEIPFSKQETYINTERMYEVLYQTEILITEEN